MKREMLGLAIIAATMMTAGQIARADETSTTSVQAVQPSLLDKFTLSYWGNWRGPSVGSFNAYTPDALGNPSDKTNNSGLVFAENVVTLGYKFTETKSLTYNFDFLTRLAGGTEGKTDKSFGTSNVINGYVGLRDKKFLNTAGINHDVMIRLYTPTSTSSQEANLIVAPALVDNATFDTGEWTVGLWQRYRYYAGTGNGALQWTIDLAPNANWQFSKKVAATMWIDAIQLSQAKGGKIENFWVDVEPGINWDVTPNISLNPFLNIYPNSMTANATSVQMVISAKAF